VLCIVLKISHGSSMSPASHPLLLTSSASPSLSRSSQSTRTTNITTLILRRRTHILSPDPISHPTSPNSLIPPHSALGQPLPLPARRGLMMEMIMFRRSRLTPPSTPQRMPMPERTPGTRRSALPLLLSAMDFIDALVRDGLVACAASAFFGLVVGYEAVDRAVDGAPEGFACAVGAVNCGAGAGG
jgi:hypothetical protein